MCPEGYYNDLPGQSDSASCKVRLRGLKYCTVPPGMNFTYAGESQACQMRVISFKPHWHS